MKVDCEVISPTGERFNTYIYLPDNFGANDTVKSLQFGNKVLTGTITEVKQGSVTIDFQQGAKPINTIKE